MCVPFLLTSILKKYLLVVPGSFLFVFRLFLLALAAERCVVLVLADAVDDVVVIIYHLKYSRLNNEVTKTINELQYLSTSARSPGWFHIGASPSPSAVIFLAGLLELVVKELFFLQSLSIKQSPQGCMIFGDDSILRLSL